MSTDYHASRGEERWPEDKALPPWEGALSEVQCMAGKPGSQPDRQKYMSAWLYFRHEVKLRKNAHTQIHTRPSEACRYHLIRAFIESIICPVRDWQEGAFHGACQSPPSSTAIWNHIADSVTSKHVWWLPRSPLNHPFLEQECFYPSSIDTAWLMLKTPAFLLDNLSFSRQE